MVAKLEQMQHEASTVCESPEALLTWQHSCRNEGDIPSLLGLNAAADVALLFLTPRLGRQPELKRKLVVDKQDKADDGRSGQLCRQAAPGICKHARKEEL